VVLVWLILKYFDFFKYTFYLGVGPTIWDASLSLYQCSRPKCVSKSSNFLSTLRLSPEQSIPVGNGLFQVLSSKFIHFHTVMGLGSKSEGTLEKKAASFPYYYSEAGKS
jgi:hypothetical protein